MKLRTIGPNQTEITFNNGEVVFFSYTTPVAALDPCGGCGWIKTEEHYSATTSRHVSQWIPKGAKVTTVPQSTLNNLVGGV